MEVSNILPEIMESLYKNVMSLTEELNRDAASQKDLRNKLEIVKALSLLDSFVEGKYYSLYIQYQAAVSKEFKDFHRQINAYIEKYDYKNVESKLLSLDEYPINDNAFNHIRRSLSNSISDLLESTKSMVIIISNTVPTEDIKQITDNLKNLESAKKHISIDFDEEHKKKFKCNGYIDVDTKEKLYTGILEIQKILSNKVQKYLENIEALISINNFYEAEEKREHLNDIRLLLGQYCKNQEITDKIDKIQETLENIVENVLTKCDETEIKDYFLNPPKLIVDKLEKVAHRNLRYIQTLSKIKIAIKDKMTRALTAAKNAHPDKRSEQLQLVQSALGSLPTEIKTNVEAQIENLEKFIEQKEKSYQQDLDKLTSNFEITAVNNFLEKCEKGGMNSILRAMQNDIIKKSKDMKDAVVNFDDGDINDLFSKFQELLKFKLAFGKTCNEINTFFSIAENKLIQMYANLTSSLNNIAKNENEQLIIRLFDQFKAFIELIAYKKSENTDDQTTKLDREVESKLNLVCSNISQFLISSQEKYTASKNDLDYENLILSLNSFKKWNSFIIKIKNFPPNLEDGTLTKARNSKEYKEVINEVKEFLKALKQEILSFELQTGLVMIRS